MSTAERLAALSAWAADAGHDPSEYQYGGGPEQIGEFHTAADGSSARVAVLIHGGFWREAYDRSSLRALAVALATRGWASWNLEYRRGAGAGTRALEDVYGGILRLPELAVLHDVVIVGHSAGGQLALCTAGRVASSLTVSLAGVADLLSAAGERIGDDAVREFIGADPERAQPDYWALDPLVRLPTGAPTLLVHGDQDDRVPVSQSRGYAAAAAAVDDPCRLLEIAGADHFDLIDPRTAACQAWLDELPD
jgi:acetyl esterase/lipase